MAAARESTAVFRTGSWRFERPVFVEQTAPCSEACPLGENIPAVMALHRQGRHLEALEKILVENPFPGVCGRICFHPCERVCNRGRFDQAVSIRDLERFAAESTPYADVVALYRGGRPSAVAVLGGGPAGLSCAWFLARLGHRVSLLEPGDRMEIEREMKDLLPAPVLEREIARLSGLGVEIVTGFSGGPDPVAALTSSYDAVYASTAGPDPALPMDLERTPERVFTLGDLKRARTEASSSEFHHVAVSGCGPTALEAVRLLRQQGVRPVVLCGASWQGPDSAGLEAAEGIELRSESGLRALSTDGDRLRVLLGGTAPSPDGGGGPPRREALEIEALVFAPDLKGARPDWIPRVLPSGLTVLRGPSSSPSGDEPEAERSRRAVRALAAGKRAAFILDCALRGLTLDLLAAVSPGRLGALSAEAYTRLLAGETDRRLDAVVRYEDLNTACFRRSTRSEASPDRGLTPGQAVYSARRCFLCGTCTFCGACDDYCPDVSIRVDRANRTRVVDYEHCKGCGICARECPRGGVVMAKESPPVPEKG
jgi:Pyruvate/2-oxoacid:ferredoxin oxidoreductase delta subunit